jgi:hypothetical protein
MRAFAINDSNKVDKLGEHELVSTSHLIQMARMDIMNFNYHMRASLREWKTTLTLLETQ